MSPKNPIPTLLTQLTKQTQDALSIPQANSVLLKNEKNNEIKKLIDVNRDAINNKTKI